LSFCPVHQAAVGPRGCAQCQREEAVAHRMETGRFWRWAGLVFGAIALSAAAAVLLLPRPVRYQRVLDPEPFRASMEMTESALYTSGRFTSEDQETLRQGLLAFYLLLRKQLPTTAQRRALEKYERYCVITPVEAEHAGFDVMAARREWEKLRGEHFARAPWFRSGSVALDRVQTSSSARGIPDDTARYQPVIDELRLLNARVETALQTARDETDYEGRNELQTFRADLRRDIERVRQQMPAAFVGMEPTWRRAHDDLEGAVRAVAGGLGPGRPSSGAYAISQAQASLDAAAR
jgi:hypothetical protein